MDNCKGSCLVEDKEEVRQSKSLCSYLASRKVSTTTVNTSRFHVLSHLLSLLFLKQGLGTWPQAKWHCSGSPLQNRLSSQLLQPRFHHNHYHQHHIQVRRVSHRTVAAHSGRECSSKSPLQLCNSQSTADVHTPAL